VKDITPFFSALKEYSKNQLERFSAMPISRGNSVFKSKWDPKILEEFYGRNMFLAEDLIHHRCELDSLLQTNWAM